MTAILHYEDDSHSAQNIHPAQRALFETLTYLSDLHHLAPDQKHSLADLAERARVARGKKALSDIEMEVKQLVFRLEHSDMQSDRSRETVLRQLIKTLLEQLKTNGRRDHDYGITISRLSEKLAHAASVPELEALRDQIATLFQRVHDQRISRHLEIRDTLREIVLCILRNFLVGTHRRDDYEQRIEDVIQMVQKAESGETLREAFAKLQSVAEIHRNRQIHHRIERLELQQIIDSLARTLDHARLSDGEIGGALDAFISFLETADAKDNTASTVLDRALSLKRSVDQLEVNFSRVHTRLQQSQQRIMVLEDETRPGVASETQQTHAPHPLEQVHEWLENAVEDFTRHKTPYCLALLDLENTTGLAKQYGDAVLDKMVQHADRYLDEQLRRLDCVVRISPTRYVLVLPNTTLRGCRTVLLRLLSGLQGLAFVLRGDALRLQCCGGISELAPGVSGPRWQRLAENALKHAKPVGAVRLGVKT